MICLVSLSIDSNRHPAARIDTTTFNVYIRTQGNSILKANMSGQEEIAKILLGSIPRELLLSFDRLYPSAIERALQIGQSADVGHRSTVVGCNRHLFLNEALMHALDECQISHSPLRGNSILVGKIGLSSIARIHVSGGKWDNSKRSKAKVKLCAPNRKVASIVQMDWLQQQAPEEITAITAFLVTQGDGTDLNPYQVFIVVPDETMDLRNPVFAEQLSIFVRRYQQVQDILDNAQPKLKSNIKKQPKSGES